MNASQLSYEHVRPFSNLTLYDGAELEASAPHVDRVLRVVLDVRVSVAASIPGSLDRLLSLEPLVVEEGGDAVVSARNLNTTAVLHFLREHQRRAGAVAVRQPIIKMQVVIYPNQYR